MAEGGEEDCKKLVEGTGGDTFISQVQSRMGADKHRMCAHTSVFGGAGHGSVPLPLYVSRRRFLLALCAYRKYMVWPVVMNKTEMITRMPKCCGCGAEITMMKWSRSIR